MKNNKETHLPFEYDAQLKINKSFINYKLNNLKIVELFIHYFKKMI
jgi:hypothetical protein